MGWPQQLDVRLDGKLLKRFTVGGNAQGRPAASSYAGDGEPGFAGDDSWEKYMQIGGDAGLEIRVPVQAGPRIVGVSFVRELWEPKASRNRCSAAASSADDQVYMGYANVGSVQIGGPSRPPGRRRTLPAAARFSSANRHLGHGRCGIRGKFRGHIRSRTGLRHQDSFEDRAAGVSTAGHDSQICGRCSNSLTTAGAEEEASTTAFNSRSNAFLSDPDFLLRVHRDPAPAKSAEGPLRSPTGSAIWNWPRACRSSCGAASPTIACSTLAERGQLTNPATLEKEVRRMLADPRAVDALVNDFAAQWLNLRRVEEVVVDPDRYPNYDESLLQAFQQETELFVASTMREDRSVLNALERQLYLCQRAAGPALWDSRNLWQPLPPRDVSEPRSARRVAGRRARCWRRRPIRIAHRRSCAANGY